LVIFGDDIGQANISRYTLGVVGYMTPNIDRIGEDGFTYRLLRGEQLHGRKVIVHHGSILSRRP
jgi:hypothetical protein